MLSFATGSLYILSLILKHLAVLLSTWVWSSSQTSFELWLCEVLLVSLPALLLYIPSFTSVHTFEWFDHHLKFWSIWALVKFWQITLCLSTYCMAGLASALNLSWFLKNAHLTLSHELSRSVLILLNGSTQLLELPCRFIFLLEATWENCFVSTLQETLSHDLSAIKWWTTTVIGLKSLLFLMLCVLSFGSVVSVSCIKLLITAIMLNAALSIL